MKGLVSAICFMLRANAWVDLLSSIQERSLETVAWAQNEHHIACQGIMVSKGIEISKWSLFMNRTLDYPYPFNITSRPGFPLSS